jgi:hypothetical protein
MVDQKLSKKVLMSNDLVIEKLHPRIWVFKNAFKEAESLVKYLENMPEKWIDWYTFGTKIEFYLPTYDDKDFPSKKKWEKEILDKMEETPLKNFCITFRDVTEEYVKQLKIKQDSWYFIDSDVCKYVSNVGISDTHAMNYHTDYRQGKAKEPGDKFELTCVTYLNESYTGGEISFRIFNQEFTEFIEEINYKPSIGDIIIFPSKHPYYHGVRILTSGEKYILRSYWRYWYKGDPETIKEKEKYSEEDWQKMSKKIENEMWNEYQQKINSLVERKNKSMVQN